MVHRCTGPGPVDLIRLISLQLFQLEAVSAISPFASLSRYPLTCIVLPHHSYYEFLTYLISSFFFHLQIFAQL